MNRRDWILADGPTGIKLVRGRKEAQFRAILGFWVPSSASRRVDGILPAIGTGQGRQRQQVWLIEAILRMDGGQRQFVESECSCFVRVENVQGLLTLKTAIRTQAYDFFFMRKIAGERDAVCAVLLTG